MLRPAARHRIRAIAEMGCGKLRHHVSALVNVETLGTSYRPAVRESPDGRVVATREPALNRAGTESSQ